MSPGRRETASCRRPQLLTNVRPGGVRSATLTPDAAFGPSFLMASVYVKVVPGVTLAGPVFVIRTSAGNVTGAGPLNSDVLAVPPGVRGRRGQARCPPGTLEPGGSGMTKRKRSVVSLPWLTPLIGPGP